MPAAPFGILVKSSLPIRFCSCVNGQWSVPTESSIRFARLFHSASVVAGVRGPDRRTHDVRRSLEVGLVEDRVVEQQVLRAGLAVAALSASLARSSACTDSLQVMCTM